MAETVYGTMPQTFETSVRLGLRMEA